jgi:hypothetical protein
MTSQYGALVGAHRHRSSIRYPMKELTRLKCHGGPSRKCWRRRAAVDTSQVIFQIEIVPAEGIRLPF